jgi:hypothetical protein
MFFEFVATITAGFAAAGLALLLSKATGGRTPRWLIPVAAGIAMLAYTIWSEYSWFDRTQASLPEGLVIVSQNESRAIYRPWTYLFPMIDRFAAVDTQSIRQNEAVPDLRLAEIYFWGRWSPIRRIPVAFDCVENLRAPLVEGVKMEADGQIKDATWTAVENGDPALATACAER